MTSKETIWEIQREFMELAKSIEAQHGVALLSVQYKRDDEGCTQSVCLSYEDRTEVLGPEQEEKSGLIKYQIKPK